MQKRVILPRVVLVCYASAIIGLGHLSRLLALAQELKKGNRVQLEFLIFEDSINKGSFADFDVHFLPLVEEFTSSVKSHVEKYNPCMVVFDLYSKHDNNLDGLFTFLKKRNIDLVGIDCLIKYCKIIDLIWMPSFYFDTSKYPDCIGTLKFGWDSFLIQKRLTESVWKPGLRVLILTGGSDVTLLSRTLPSKLDASLRKNSKINWVRGPFSELPILPDECRLEWNVHDSPSQLDELIVQSDYVLTVYGVSLFEVLQYGIPSVVFSPYGDKDFNELLSLSKEKVTLVSDNDQAAIDSLIKLMKNDKLARECSSNALNKLSINGTQKLSEEIYLLIGV